MLRRVAASLFFAAPALGQATFQGLGQVNGRPPGNYALAVNSNGSVVAGYAFQPNLLYEAFRWTEAGGWVSLGFLDDANPTSTACGISADGSVVVGSSADVCNGNVTNAGFRWTKAGDMVGLDWPDSACGAEIVAASASGTVLAGTGYLPDRFEAFRWSNAGGWSDGLGVLDQNNPWSRAAGISADGSVVVGHSYRAQGQEAFRWTKAGGMKGLGDLPGGPLASAAYAASEDGSVVVGSGALEGGIEAFRWTAQGGMTALGDLPGGQHFSEALGVSGDGNVVVGYGSVDQGARAFLWFADAGVVDLRDLLLSRGATGLNGWTLLRATAVSAEGGIVVGIGSNPQGQTEAWIADLRWSNCYADLNGDGTLNLFDFLAFVNAFNNEEQAADCDDDQSFTLFDFLCFTNWFNGGC